VPSSFFVLAPLLLSYLAAFSLPPLFSVMGSFFSHYRERQCYLISITFSPASSEVILSVISLSFFVVILPFSLLFGVFLEDAPRDRYEPSSPSFPAEAHPGCKPFPGGNPFCPTNSLAGQPNRSFFLSLFFSFPRLFLPGLAVPP